MKWTRPVSIPFEVTSSAVQHLARSPLCGIDYISTKDNTLYAMSDGELVYAHKSYNPELALDTNTYDSLGKFIVIEHHIECLPIYVRYCHSELIGIEGTSVKCGDDIGQWGNTGYSFGAHVHVDFWMAREHIARVQELGIDPLPAPFERCPWPGTIHLYSNVNPTRFLVRQFNGGK